jgi:hypothetical protein
MHRTGRIGFVVAFTLLMGACATTVRNPIEDVPPGEYVMVEPESDVYTAVALNETAFTVRMDDAIHSGQHWVDADGRIHMVNDAGPCADVESIWTYDYSGDRFTLNLVEDQCQVRPQPFPDQVVYERN